MGFWGKDKIRWINVIKVLTEGASYNVGILNRVREKCKQIEVNAKINSVISNIMLTTTVRCFIRVPLEWKFT